MIHESKIGIGIFILLLLVGFLGFFQPNVQASVDCPTGTYMDIETGEWKNNLGNPLSTEEIKACEYIDEPLFQEKFIMVFTIVFFAIFLFLALLTIATLVIGIVMAIKNHQDDSNKMIMWLVIHICAFLFSGLSIVSVSIHLIMIGYKKWGIILLSVFGGSILIAIILWIIGFIVSV